jgi:ankyrin repeat protein
VLAADGQTPLHHAAMQADPAPARQLLGSGADVAARDRWGQTPLHLAAYSGRATLVAMLLDHGAKIDEQDDDGETALYKAAARGQVDAMRVLLYRGAKPDLPRQSQPGNKSPSGDPPIVKAAREEQDEAIRMLIRFKANVNAPGEDGFRALQIAAGKNRLTLMQSLLQAGADINATDTAGNTPLHRAASRGKPEAVRLLLQQKPPADLSAKNAQGQTPFLAAAAGGEAEICDVLLNAGSNAKAVDNDGNTALHLAVNVEDERTVRRLLERKLDRSAKNKQGKTPAELTTNERIKSNFGDSHPATAP